MKLQNKSLPHIQSKNKNETWKIFSFLVVVNPSEIDYFFSLFYFRYSPQKLQDDYGSSFKKTFPKKILLPKIYDLDMNPVRQDNHIAEKRCILAVENMTNCKILLPNGGKVHWYKSHPCIHVGITNIKRLNYVSVILSYLEHHAPFIINHAIFKVPLLCPTATWSSYLTGISTSRQLHSKDFYIGFPTRHSYLNNNQTSLVQAQLDKKRSEGNHIRFSFSKQINAHKMYKGIARQKSIFRIPRIIDLIKGQAPKLKNEERTTILNSSSEAGDTIETKTKVNEVSNTGFDKIQTCLETTYNVDFESEIVPEKSEFKTENSDPMLTKTSSKHNGDDENNEKSQQSTYSPKRSAEEFKSNEKNSDTEKSVNNDDNKEELSTNLDNKTDGSNFDREDTTSEKIKVSNKSDDTGACEVNQLTLDSNKQSIDGGQKNTTENVNIEMNILDKDLKDEMKTSTQEEVTTSSKRTGSETDTTTDTNDKSGTSSTVKSSDRAIENKFIVKRSKSMNESPVTSTTLTSQIKKVESQDQHIYFSGTSSKVTTEPDFIIMEEEENKLPDANNSSSNSKWKTLSRKEFSSKMPHNRQLSLNNFDESITKSIEKPRKVSFRFKESPRLCDPLRGSKHIESENNIRSISRHRGKLLRSESLKSLSNTLKTFSRQNSRERTILKSSPCLSYNDCVKQLFNDLKDTPKENENNCNSKLSKVKFKESGDEQSNCISALDWVTGDASSTSEELNTDISLKHSENIRSTNLDNEVNSEDEAAKYQDQLRHSLLKLNKYCSSLDISVKDSKKISSTIFETMDLADKIIKKKKSGDCSTNSISVSSSNVYPNCMKSNDNCELSESEDSTVKSFKFDPKEEKEKPPEQAFDLVTIGYDNYQEYSASDSPDDSINSEMKEECLVKLDSSQVFIENNSSFVKGNICKYQQSLEKIIEILYGVVDTTHSYIFEWAINLYMLDSIVMRLAKQCYHDPADDCNDNTSELSNSKISEKSNSRIPKLSKYTRGYNSNYKIHDYRLDGPQKHFHQAGATEAETAQIKDNKSHSFIPIAALHSNEVDGTVKLHGKLKIRKFSENIA